MEGAKCNVFPRIVENFSREISNYNPFRRGVRQSVIDYEHDINLPVHRVNVTVPWRTAYRFDVLRSHRRSIRVAKSR